MTGTIRKRVISLLLALAVLFSAGVSWSTFGELKAYAFTMPSEPTTMSEVTNRLNTIIEKWRGKTLVAMKQGGDSSYGSGDGDCFNFAKAVLEYVFGLWAPGSFTKNEPFEWYMYDGNGRQVLRKINQCASSNTAQISKEKFSQARQGDFIMTTCIMASGATCQHTMVVYSIQDDGITVLDCNGLGDEIIRMRTLTWDSFARINYPKFTIYRANIKLDEVPLPPRPKHMTARTKPMP